MSCFPFFLLTASIQLYKINPAVKYKTVLTRVKMEKASVKMAVVLVAPRYHVISTLEKGVATEGRGEAVGEIHRAYEEVIIDVGKKNNRILCSAG